MRVVVCKLRFFPSPPLQPKSPINFQFRSKSTYWYESNFAARLPQSQIIAIQVKLEVDEVDELRLQQNGQKVRLQPTGAQRYVRVSAKFWRHFFRSSATGRKYLAQRK